MQTAKIIGPKNEKTATGAMDSIVDIMKHNTLHMTGYAPACTKSVEKGSFLDIRRRRRLLQKGYIFRC